MTDFRLDMPAALLANVIYQRLYEEIGLEVLEISSQLREMALAQNALREKMIYKTGSIDFASCVITYILTRKIRPTIVAEVGTFIGRSTLSMASAMDFHGGGKIITCDKDNPFCLPETFGRVSIIGNSFCGSHDMFKKIEASGEKIDMFFLDGRISPSDVDIIQKIASDNVVFLLDDFEGIEKGVVNAFLLKQTPAFGKYILLPPMQLPASESWDWRGENKVAVLVPSNVFRVTAQ